MTSTANQLALFELCDVCHQPYTGHGHRACWKALDRWVVHFIEVFGLDHASEA
jgi:hypothetical protein